MRKYSINRNLVCTSKHLYDTVANFAVQMSGSIREWFRTIVGARQGCLLSPACFNIFLKSIMCEHDGKVRIGGRYITSLLFADDIDSQEEQEQEAIAESLDKTFTRYKMEYALRIPN